MSIEEWRPVVGWEGFYEVSSQGGVRSVTRTTTLLDGQRRTYQGKVLVRVIREGGYEVVSLCRAGHCRTLHVHRLVLEAFVGPRPLRYVCCHGNGVPADNRVENLRWDTESANVRDSILHGTQRMTRKTHCLRGHPFDATNTLVLQDGHRRQCRACSRTRSLAFAARNSKKGFTS